MWNDFFWSLVLTPASPDGMLAPAGLNNIIRGRFYNAWNVMAAGSMLVALPPVIMFFLLQKQFIAGLTLGAKQRLKKKGPLRRGLANILSRKLKF